MKIKQSLLRSIFSVMSSLQIVFPSFAINPPETNSSIYRNCQQKRAAVVTVYSGSEVGSGSIIRSDGIIITNYHVIKQSLLTSGKKKIYIYLQNGKTYTGELLRPIEEKKDLALVKINVQEPLETIALDSSQKIKAGELVCAIGSPYNQPGKITQGNFKEFRSNGDLRSSVRILPGNSGGPLLNSQGKMIGVVKSAWYSSSGGNTGVSFAVSVADALQLIQQNKISLPTDQSTKEPEVTSPPKFSQLLEASSLITPPVAIPVLKPQTNILPSEKITIPTASPSSKQESLDSNRSLTPSFVVPTFPLDGSVQYQY